MDTKAFYTDEEMDLSRKIDDMRNERRKIKKILNICKAHSSGALSDKKALRRLRDVRRDIDTIPSDDEVAALSAQSKALIKPINDGKAALVDMLSAFHGVRQFREEFLSPKNIISIFESELTRTLGVGTQELTMDLIVVKTCFFKVLEDIVLNGFLLQGERYVCFTASAGQIRTKRSVFIRESQLDKYSLKLMCGLTIEHINDMGGINTNKYLAYLALCNSATDIWEGFDIYKTIVVDDLETEVMATVDFIDDKTYTISRQQMGVPITHTDGAGMVRLDVSRKNFMIRLPWVKGLLAAFPFDKFIREADRADPTTNHGLVKDIYGVEHDILAEDIQIIFTKSQVKMWKFYENWAQYQYFFTKYGCNACICNIEPDSFDKAKINYQMLQTLTDLTDDELMAISSETRRRLRDISSDRETMLRVFGATKENPRRSDLQEALLIYPELLQDEYTRETLREIRRSIEKEAKAGRLDVDGYYTFIIPDMYAFCQHLFLGEEAPSGLLRDGEVYCSLFPAEQDLDCLRSPHLYMEHAVRKNVFGTDSERKRWFVTPGLYTSVHDTISKILQFDCDGDKALVVQDRTIVEVAKRDSSDIVPLFYNMAKAGAQPLTSQAIYDSMILAYTGGNIGQISNDISCIWNSGHPKEAIDAVKYLTMENNFTIDYAKTLYKPTRPPHIHEQIHAYTKHKVPHFFIYAKGKTDAQVEPLSSSPVDRLEHIIPHDRLEFQARTLGKFDPKMLMHDQLVPSNDITQKIISTYEHISRTDIMRLQLNENGRPRSSWGYRTLLDALLEIYNDKTFITDVLIKELFVRRKSKRKNIFWACFGDVVVENLRHNLGSKTGMCVHCGRRFYRESNRQVMCTECAKRRTRAANAERKRRSRAKNVTV